MIVAVAFAASRIAVISVGTDPVPAGQLQRSVESRLVAIPSVDLLDASALAVEIGVKPEGAVATRIDPEAARRLEELLEAARQNSRNGEYGEALERLLVAEGLLDPAGTEDRVRVLLQRGAVLLKMEDPEKAAASARTALELRPDLTVDLGIFPPSLASLVNEVRSTIPLRFTVELPDIPSAARVLLDGRPVAHRFAAVPGRHKLGVTAPGFRSLEIPLEVTKNATLDLSLPIALERVLESSLSEQLWAPDAASKDRIVVRELATRLKVDGLVLVASRSNSVAEARALVVWRNSTDAAEVGPTKPTSAAGRTALTEWIATRIEAGAPRPPETGEVRRRPPSPAVWSLRGGIQVLSRRRVVDGAGDTGFRTDFIGIGARLTAEVRKRGWTAQVEAGMQKYDNEKVNLPGGGSGTLEGGTGTRAGMAGGFGIGSERIRVTPLVGVFLETLEGTDAKDSSGNPVGLHPRQDWFGAFGRLEATSTIRGQWVLSGAFSYSPSGFSGVKERPQYTSGANAPGHAKDTDDRGGWIAEGGLGWLPIDALCLAVEYSHAVRAVDFKGEAVAPFVPPLVDARDTQTVDSLLLSARYRF